MIACFFIVGIHGLASAQKLPVIDGKKVVAIVNDETITLEELNEAIAASHKARSGERKAGRIDFSGIMERLINTRLLLFEAKNMGIDELPEIKNMVEKYAKETLAKLVLMQYAKDIEPDDKEVERLYREIYREQVKEWKIKSLQFKKEADAKRIEAEIKAGNNFDELAEKAVAEGIAEGGAVEYLKNKDLKPRVAEIVSKMENGSTSPIVPVGQKGFIIFKLEGFHLPEKEDPETRMKAERLALKQIKTRAVKDYFEDLKKKYSNLNEELLDGLDYESKEPGFESLLKDERAVVEILGEDPITVGDLSKALKKKFFHGVEKAIQSKRINKRKRLILENMLETRVLLKEASIQGLDQTEVYKNKVNEYENSLIFGAFIQKVVAPEIKLNEKELRAYYKENSQSYTSPQMMRIKSLVFEKRTDAVDALDKLKQGTDFPWLSSHAEGQVDKDTQGLLKFEGKMLVLSSLPKGVQKAVSGVNPGDLRMYASPEGHYYVLYVYHVVVPQQRPFDDVKKEIAKKVYNDKINKAVDDYADKLKEYYPVKIYRKDLRK
jgi:hypothetical protein